MDTARFAQEVIKARKRVDLLSQRKESNDTNEQELLEQSLGELQIFVEELRVAHEELTQQNEELMLTRNKVEAERQRYQDLFEFAPDGYLVTTLEGVILEANRAAAEMLGIAQRFLIGKLLINFIAEAERKKFRLLHNRFNQTHNELPQEIEARLHSRDGKPFDAALTVAPVQNNYGKI